METIETRKNKKPIVLVIVLSLAIYFASAIIGTLLLSPLFFITGDISESNFILMVSITQMFLCGIPIFFLLRKKKFWYFAFKISKGEVWLIILALFLGFTFSDLAGLIPMTFEFTGSFGIDEMIAQNSIGSDGNPILQILGVAVAAAIVEEMIFRGAIFGPIRSRIGGKKGFWIAAIISSSIFAVAHGINMIMIFALLIGIMYAYIYEKTGNLFISMLVHFLNNFISVICGIIFVADSSQAEMETLISSVTGNVPALIITTVLAIASAVILVRITRNMKSISFN